MLAHSHYPLGSDTWSSEDDLQCAGYVHQVKQDVRSTMVWKVEVTSPNTWQDLLTACPHFLVQRKSWSPVFSAYIPTTENLKQTQEFWRHCFLDSFFLWCDPRNAQLVLLGSPCQEQPKGALHLLSVQVLRLYAPQGEMLCSAKAPTSPSTALMHSLSLWNLSVSLCGVDIHHLRVSQRAEK